MALITPIITLPNYTVDKLADSDSQSRQREKRKDKEREGSPTPNPLVENSKETSGESQSTDLSMEPSQQLDTETTVKLLDEQVKTPQGGSSPYETVKNLTPDLKLVREI